MTRQKLQIHKRGDVVLVLFPDSNLRTAKPRPALVVQADNLGTGLPQVIVAMVTGNISRANHPGRMLVLLSTQKANILDGWHVWSSSFSLSFLR
jgi:mRNA interferase MazF